jgi:hypothetical protein
VSPISVSLAELDQAWADRLEADTDFATAIGMDAANEVRLYRGWPHDLLAKPANEDMPRGTYFRVIRKPLTENPEVVMIQSDLWGTRTQWDQLTAADDAMTAALTDSKGGAATWFDAARSLYLSSRLVDSDDPQEEFFIRRRHLWEVAPA